MDDPQLELPNKTLDRMTRSAVSRAFQCGRPWRAPRHLSASRQLSMRRDFEIKDGIYLVQSPHELDLHNNFDFQDLRYSVEDRTLLLRWRRSKGDWVAPGIPASVSVESREASEFRFLPR